MNKHTFSPIPNALTRRQWAAGCAAALLAGCGTGPVRQVAGPVVSTPSAGAAVPPSQPPLDLNPTYREDVVARAMLLINTPYTYGGNTPRGGFDCSGLVHYVFSQAVADGAGATPRLPRSTAQWAAVTVPLDDAALQRGDLVFFNTSGAMFSHMGIFVGAGQFVHAPSTGGTVRKALVASRYFGPRYVGARRVFRA